MLGKFSHFVENAIKPIEHQVHQNVESGAVPYGKLMHTGDAANYEHEAPSRFICALDKQHDIFGTTGCESCVATTLRLKAENHPVPNKIQKLIDDPSA